MAKNIFKRLIDRFAFQPEVQKAVPTDSKALLREYIPTANKYFFQNLTFPSFIDPMRIRRDIRRYTWVLERMMLDDKLKAAHDFKVTSVLAADWEIKPISENPVDTMIADFVQENLDNLEIPFDDMLRNLCDAWNYGYKLAEKIYYIKEGRYYLKTIKNKPSKVIRFNVDDFSNLVSCQYVLGNMQEVIPPDKFVIYINPYLKDGEWYGEPDLVAVYREWWSKDTLVKIRNIAARTHAMPIRQLIYDENITDDELQTMKDEVDDVHENLAIYVPGKRDEASGKLIPIVDLTFLESHRTTTPEFNAIIDQLDNAMLRRLLIGDKLGVSQTEGKSGGSFAMAKVHYDLFTEGILEFLHHHIEKIIQKDIVKQLVDLNFPNVTDYPTFKFKVADADLGNRVTILGNAVKAGLVDPNESWVRPYLKWPEIPAGLVLQVPGTPQGASVEPPVNPPKLAKLTPPNQQMDKESQASQARSAQSGKGQQAPVDTLPYKAKFKSKVINYERIEKGLNEVESKCLLKLAFVFKEIREDLLNKTRRLHTDGKKDTIKAFKGSLLSELKAIFQTCFTQGYINGQGEAKDEIKKGKGEFGHYEWNVETFELNAKEQNLIKQRAFYVTGVVQTDVLKKVNQILLDDIGEESVNASMKKIEDVLAPYLETGEIDGKVAEPWMLQTIVRTNESDMFNEGRMSEFEDPELNGFVQAFEYSAVLDDRTTDFCEEHDGQTLEADDPRVDEFPPAHYNCRSIWSPTFRGEDYTTDWDDSIQPMEGFSAIIPKS